MADHEAIVCDGDQKMSTEPENNQTREDQQQRPQNQIDLRELSIFLDGWSRTCDTVLNTLNEQINKIIKNNDKSWGHFIL